MGIRSSASQIVKELGRWDGALYVVGRLLQRVSRQRLRIVKYYLVAQPIGRPDAPLPLRPDAATTLHAVAVDDPAVPFFPRRPDVIAARYAVGASCTVARVRGRFAGFIWLQRGHYDEDELRCRYVLAAPAVSVWDYDVYVEPTYRIGRTMARLWQHVDGQLAAQGVRWSFSRISAFNAASLASHARLGTVACGSATFLLIGDWQLSRLPRFPWLHLSTGAGRAPRVHLRPPPG